MTLKGGGVNFTRERLPHRLIGFDSYGTEGLRVICSCGWWHACRTEDIGNRLLQEHVEWYAKAADNE